MEGVGDGEVSLVEEGGIGFDHFLIPDFCESLVIFDLINIGEAYLLPGWFGAFLLHVDGDDAFLLGDGAVELVAAVHITINYKLQRVLNGEYK
jgi:hypothetical protein